MAALSPTATTQRSSIGDLIERTYTLSGTNGDTFTPPGQTSIRAVFPIPTTAISIGYTLSGNTITFVTSGAWAAAVTVHSREG
jgi:hypothetical protein